MRRLQLVWRRGLRQRQKLERAVEHAGVQARLGSSKRTPRPLLGIARQNDRAMQERRRRGQAAARLRAAGGLLERRGDRLVGPRCGCGQMPRATVGVDAAVGRLSQGQMDLPALLSGRHSVDSGAHQRMTECHALSEREQPVGLRVRAETAIPSRSAAASRSSGSPTGSAAATSSRRRASSESVSTRRTKLSSMRPASPCASMRPKPPANCRCRQAPRELEQGQRVPVRLGNDPVADWRIQPEPHGRAQQRPGVVPE